MSYPGDNRRADIMAFITAYTAKHGIPPTVREIGPAVGLEGPSTVAAHLRALVRQGRLEKVGGVGQARGYMAPREKTCPHCGGKL